MAHGTGLYWIKDHEATIQTGEYAAVFFRLRNYYYEPMSDCYEPSWKDTGEYRVEVRRWRKDRFGDLVADEISEGCSTGSIDKDTANRIYWNIKNRPVSFRQCRRYFQEIAGREIRA